MSMEIERVVRRHSQSGADGICWWLGYIGGGSGAGGEQGPILAWGTRRLSGGGREVGLGVRSQEQGFAASCGGHIWCLPWLTSRVHLVLGRRKQALMRGSCGRAAGSHLFCFQHQRPEKRLSGPEGHGHPSWRLHRREARSPWPVAAHSVRRIPPPLSSTISWLQL